MERIAKYLAACGVASRRKAEELVFDGAVTVNGVCVTDCAWKVDPDADAVKVNGKLVRVQYKKYFLVHKPRGYVTTRQDTHERKTVLELLPLKHRDVHPVGRLDIETSGLLLLTNDGDFTLHVTHPRYEVPKIYDVVMHGSLDNRDIEHLQKGVHLSDGKTQPVRILDLKDRRTTTHARLEIREGRNREVRRICETLGHPVVSLKRIGVGSLRLGELKQGGYRELTKEEVESLRTYHRQAKKKHTVRTDDGEARKKVGRRSHS